MHYLVASFKGNSFKNIFFRISRPLKPFSILGGLF